MILFYSDAAYSSLTQHSRRPFSLEREAPLQDQKQYTLPGRNADFNLTGISAEDRRKSNLKTRPDVTDNRSVYNRPSNSHGKYDETPDNLIAEKFNKKYGDMPDYRTGDGQLNNYGRNAELKMPEKGGDQHLSRMGKSMDLESLKKELDSRTSNTDRYKKFEVQGKQDDRRTSMMGQSLDFESRGKSPDRPGSSLERPGNFEVSSKSAHDDLNRRKNYISSICVNSIPTSIIGRKQVCMIHCAYAHKLSILIRSSEYISPLHCLRPNYVEPTQS